MQSRNDQLLPKASKHRWMLFTHIADSAEISLEVEYWSHAASSLGRLSSMYTDAAALDTIGRVNRLLSAWPTDDTLTAEGYDIMKGTFKKLSSGLIEIKSAAERDAK